MNVIRMGIIIFITTLFISGCESLQTPTDSNVQTQWASSFSKSAKKVASASGQGSVIMGEGWRRIFTFHATAYDNGTVYGKGMLTKVSNNADKRQQFQFEIDCMVIEGNMAILMGTITKEIKSMPGDPVWLGRNFQFKVIDNGEGNKSAPDEMSWFANWAPGNTDDSVQFIPECGEDLQWSFFQIEAGNIQIK